jgi:tripartite-type tricarboxylate transporter receptor subunit TctC
MIKILHRLGVLLLGACALVMGAAQAAYPDKPVNLVVPYPPGGPTDVIARLIAQKLSIEWHQSVIVNNRPGAGSTVAAEYVARAAGDGYTLYMTTAAHTISASLYKNLNYDSIRDFAPISMICNLPLGLVTAPKVPAHTVQEVIDFAKRSPQGVTLGSTGNGTPQHLTGQLFATRTGIHIVHVPYRGDSPLLVDLMSGQVQIAFVALSSALPQIKNGRLNAIAVANHVRLDAMPDVPTFAEQGMPNFEAATWIGLLAPASMPKALQQQIHRDVSKILLMPDVRKSLADLVGEINDMSIDQFKESMIAESKRWAEAVKLSGAYID